MKRELFEELLVSAKEAREHARCPLLPCADLIVLKADAPTERVGSIVLAPTAQRSAARGTVVAVGPEFEQDLDVGAHVAYSRWLSEVEVGEETWLLVRGEDVLAVLA